MTIQEQYPYLAKLNPAQLEAATFIDGMLMMYAGAGCGKTATVASRIAYMIDQGVDPSSILLLTFTNKAAGEMKDRVTKMAGENGARVTATTFHSFCAMILRKYAACVNIQNDFRILDENDADDTIDLCITQYCEQKYKNDAPKEFPSKKQINAVFSYCVDYSVSIDEGLNAKCFLDICTYSDDIKAIIVLYNTYKRNHNMVDYSDLMRLMYVLLACNESVRAVLDKQYKYISCDEYQDTNVIQDKILSMLSQDYPNLAVVGDDNQSIYAFRGAHVENIITFAKRHTNCHTVKLVENYRSTQEILDFANAVMSHATEGIEKVLHGQRSGYEKPLIKDCPDTFAEADDLFDEIMDIVKRGGHYSDCAVLMRSSRSSTILEGKLMKSDIPFKKFGGLKFIDHACVKDTLSYIKALGMPTDVVSWFRILQLYPGIGKVTARKLAENIASNGLEAVAQTNIKKKYYPFLQELMEHFHTVSGQDFSTGVKTLTDIYYPKVRRRQIDISNAAATTKREQLNRLEGNDKEDLNLLCDISNHHKSIDAFLEAFALDSNGTVDTDDYVTLSTVHSAKGLEYKHVFVLDCYDGGCPLFSKGKGSTNIPEELRIFYVAITRAKDSLTLYVPRICNSLRVEESRFLAHSNVRNMADRIGIDYRAYSANPLEWDDCDW